MAEAVLVAIGMAMASGFLKPVMEKCGDAVSKTDSAAGLNSALLGNLNPKLAELKEELGKLDGLLSHAQKRNPERDTDNKLLSPWLKKIKEAAIFADNLLEDISYYHLRREVEGGSKVGQIFRASDGTSIAFRNKIGSKVNKFKSMADDIYKAAAKINPGLELVTNTRYQAVAGAEPAMSTNLTDIRGSPDTSIIVGRDREKEEIVRELCRTDLGEVLGVIAMVGMPGVGKTALAKNIYENETVKEIYKKKTWIYVSQKFDLKRILDEMLQSPTGESHNLSNTDLMEKKLQECLQKERYLLVLDDVWDTEGAWGTIRSSLCKVTIGCTDSKVLVTTQSSEVASVMDVYLTQKIAVLSNDDAWALFKRQAFANKSQQEVSELRDIGERILRECGDLPLAINTLASLLKSKNKSQWEKVEKDSVWKSSLNQKTNIMPRLLLCLNHLPNSIAKQCFAHCSVMIPKGGYNTEEGLTESWIAQGFIQPSETTDESNKVEIGRTYIKSLVANNLLQSNEHTKPKQFTMHDLIHDLALYVSMDSCLNISDSNDLPKASAIVEHVLIEDGNTCNTQLNFPEGNTQSTLRTLFCVKAPISIELVAQARFLRQLHLKGCGLEVIPSSIGGLTHLRILDLEDNPFEKLPETIGKLYNLRALYLKSCLQVGELPKTVTKLIKLRSIATEPLSIPKGMGRLTHLTQLPEVKLKAKDGCKIKELGNLQQLRGTVKIEQLENLSSKDAETARLEDKEGIIELVLGWTIGHGEDKVMEALQPHPNLKVLRVVNFNGNIFSAWLSDGLYCTSLTSLYLTNCKRLERLPTLGCLQSLVVLSIDGMESVEVIGSDFYCPNDTSQRKLFPSLKELNLVSMQKLKEWVDPSGSGSGAEAFPCLEKLLIQNCSSLVKVPTCFQSLKQLTVVGINSGEPIQMILSSSDKLTSLKVKNVEHLTCLTGPLLNCTSLQLLEIDCCKELVELPSSLQSLGCLETLQVSGCDSLTSLPDIKGLLSL